LIAHTLHTALKWGKAKRVIVSTDSPKIAKVALRYGAEVPFMRPAALATDTSGKIPVVKHAVAACEELYGETYDIVVDLDATAPLRTVKDLDACLDIFLKDRPKTLFSVVPSHKNPYFNMVEQSKTGQVSMCKKLKKTIVRRQDAPQVYDANASIYFYDRTYLLTSNNPLPVNDHCRIYVMPDVSGFDVDREIDFQFLEFLIKRKIIRL